MSDNNESDHLSNLSDGAGCTEIWEHLSEQRAAAEADDTSEADDAADAADAADESTEDAPEKDAATEVPCP